MSLQTLRDMRMARRRPGLLMVVIGARTPVDDRPDVVTVLDAPERLDWRPVIGVPAAFFVAGDALELGERAFKAALAAGAVPIGMVHGGDAVTLDDAAKPILAQMWEALCRS